MARREEQEHIIPARPTPTGIPRFIMGRGVMTFLEFEGGFWGIKGTRGGNYLPSNLSEEYQVNGMEVIFVAKVQTDVATIYMWGTPIEILFIREVRKPDILQQI